MCLTHFFDLFIPLEYDRLIHMSKGIEEGIYIVANYRDRSSAKSNPNVAGRCGQNMEAYRGSNEEPDDASMPSI